jgi:sulfate adenylyltransferase
MNGLLWPMPVTLDVSKELAEKLQISQKIGLYDPEGNLIAIMTIESIWQPGLSLINLKVLNITCKDLSLEAQSVFGTTDQLHPAVHYLMNVSGLCKCL